MPLFRTIASLAVLAMLAAPAAAQESGRARLHERPQQGEDRAEAALPQASGIFSLIPADAVSDHILKAQEGDLAYSATAGTLDLFGQDGSRTRGFSTRPMSRRTGARAGRSPLPSMAGRGRPLPTCISVSSARKSSTSRPAPMSAPDRN